MKQRVSVIVENKPSGVRFDSLPLYTFFRSLNGDNKKVYLKLGQNSALDVAAQESVGVINPYVIVPENVLIELG